MFHVEIQFQVFVTNILLLYLYHALIAVTTTPSKFD